MYFTKKQKEELLVELKRLVEHPNVKDIINPIKMSEKSSVGSSGTLYLTKNGLKEDWEWHDTDAHDSFNPFDSHRSDSGIRKIETTKDMERVIKEYNLTRGRIRAALTKLL